jgi:hypothetical protein
MLSHSSVAATLPSFGLKSARRLGLKLTAGSVKDGFLEFEGGDGTTIQLFESDSKKSAAAIPSALP